MEQWRDVVGYEGLYRVSNYGNVFSVRKDRLLKTETTNKGYLRVCLRKDGKEKHLKVHRLVANAFIPNPNNYPQVNHKDEVKTNNCAFNLEWCTNDYNAHYGTRNERVAKAKSKPVCQYKDGVLVHVYPSMTEAARHGYYNSGINDCCRGKIKTHKGYEWRWC